MGGAPERTLARKFIFNPDKVLQSLPGRDK
jgi:hypothetical protein